MDIDSGQVMWLGVKREERQNYGKNASIPPCFEKRGIPESQSPDFADVKMFTESRELNYAILAFHFLLSPVSPQWILYLWLPQYFQRSPPLILGVPHVPLYKILFVCFWEVLKVFYPFLQMEHWYYHTLFDCF